VVVIFGALSFAKVLLMSTMKLVFFLAGNLLFGKEIRISNIEIRNKFEYQMTKCSKLKRTIFEFSNDQPRIVWQKKNLYRFLNGFEF